MEAKCFGEFMGTLVLVLLGDGVVANVLLKQSKAEGAGWMVITSGWAFAVLAGVFVAVACGSPDAHINPAVTLGFAVSSGSFVKVVPCIVAQILEAVAGATLVWLHFLPHWEKTDDPGLKLACFSTAPAIRTFAANLLSEIIGTVVLVSWWEPSSRRRWPAPAWFRASVLTWLPPWCGASDSLWEEQPAMRSIRRGISVPAWHMLSFRLREKGKSDWGYAIVPILGPLLGGALAGLLLHAVRI